MKDATITVIVPCYNVEKYVRKCLDSILNQTYKNLEIIVIDDCSTDNTRDILDEYASKPNIKYLKNEKNRGLAYTRNFGTKMASGAFIGFIDSDDFIGENYYQELYDSIVKEGSDIAIADVNIVYENNSVSNQLSKATDGGNKKIDFINNGLAASACNKLFKKDLIASYSFLEGKINEDIAAVIPAMVYAKKLSHVPTVQYNYVQRSSSIQNSSISFKRFDVFDAVEVCLKRIKGVKDYYKYKEAIVFQQIIMFFVYVIPKEDKFFNRYKLLKEYSKLSRKYNVKKNQNLWKFIDGQGKKHKYYYKALLNFNCKGFSMLTNFTIEFCKFYKFHFNNSVIKGDITIDNLISEAKRQGKMKKNDFTISVVVPNYNYERFMLQRLYSILYQTVKINELIILDDCSKDNSRELIDELYIKLKPYIDIKIIYNETNSGSAFKQWEKGFEVAKSDYIWIAEADDYCDKQFLKNVTAPLKKQKDIVISYADTAFVDTDGKVFMKTIKPEIDIMKTGHWDSSYINEGLDELNNYAYLNCTIANVSSVIFKAGKYSKYFKMSGKYKQAGDWLFYVNVMQHGKISYYNKPLNYYRVHGNNVSSTVKKQAHMNEMKKIHNYLIKTFNLKKRHKNQIDKRYKFLGKAWKL